MIQINELKFGYPRKSDLFRDLNLELQPGAIYGLLGQNGAGKTSLLKIIMGLLHPKAGACRVFGAESQKRAPQMLSELYIIPEEFQLPPVTIKNYVAIHAPFYPRFDRTMFKNLLQEFKLNAGEKISTLSYGQKKKVLLCFGLATQCRYLILDEPTNGLDIPSKSQFRRMIASGMTEERTFIISTHQVRDMESLMDPIIVLDNGKIIFQETLENISRKLAFKVVSDSTQNDDILYAEDQLNGKAAIVKNTGNEETQTNLELLFSGIIQNPEKINLALKN